MGKLKHIVIEKRHVEVRYDEEQERVALQLEEYFNYRSNPDGLEDYEYFSIEDFLCELAKGRSDFGGVIVRDGELVKDREFPEIFARWQRQKYRVALHEAAHTCACVELRVAFQYVTVIPNERSGGHVRVCLEPIGPDADAIITLAGPAADEKWQPFSSQVQRSAHNEIYEARMYAEVSQDHFNFLKWLTKNFVEKFAHEIEVVAAALFERKTLTSDEVHDVLADMRTNPKERIPVQPQNPFSAYGDDYEEE